MSKSSVADAVVRTVHPKGSIIVHKSFFLLILSCLLHLCESEEEGFQKFGGTPVRDAEYTWFSGVFEWRDNRFVCGASLIGKRHVLTASHCIRSPMDVRVEVGYLCQDRDNCRRINQLYTVRDLYRHPDGGDLALLTLSEDVELEGITPAVPNLGPSIHPGQQLLEDDLIMTLVGAGLTSKGGERSFRVEKLDVKYFPDKDQCRDKLTKPDLVDDFIICSEGQGGAACKGDSGSALVVPGKFYWQGRDVVMAVHSFGFMDCSGANDRPMGHFLLSTAADFLFRHVCEGEFPEEWCEVRFPHREMDWFVAILDAEDNRLRCGGVLIGSRYAVTISACVGRLVTNYVVDVGYYCENSQTGDDNCGKLHEILALNEIYRDEAEDVALLVLRQAVSIGVQPVVPYLGPSIHPNQRKLKKGVKMSLVAIDDVVTSLDMTYLKRKKC